MNRYTVVAFCLAAVLISASCWGPKKSIEEEKVLATLSNIQGNLETTINNLLTCWARPKLELIF